MEHEKLSYIEALYWLAQKFSISIPDEYDKAKFANIKPAKPLSAEDVDAVVEAMKLGAQLALLNRRK